MSVIAIVDAPVIARTSAYNREATTSTPPGSVVVFGLSGIKFIPDIVLVVFTVEPGFT